MKMSFWQYFKYSFEYVWTNPYWYLLLAIFVYIPIILHYQVLGWIFSLIYAITGPFFWLLMLVLHNRCRT